MKGGKNLFSKKHWSIVLYLFFVYLQSAQTQVQKYPELLNEQASSIILLPDPQNYTKFYRQQPVFDMMNRWIVSEMDELNIKAVFCTGDLVEQNEMFVPDGINGDQTSTNQWKAVSNAFKHLDPVLPYFISLGNHDYGYQNGENRNTQFNTYFPVERNAHWKSMIVDVFQEDGKSLSLENAAYALQIPHWQDILVVTTEFAPRDVVLDWIKQLASSDPYSDHIIILLTHSYLQSDGQRIIQENYKMKPANYGENIWNKLIRNTSNIRLVISGHYAVTDRDFRKNVGYKTDINNLNKRVHQMMFNAQTAGGGWHGNGGDGWLRILEFDSDGKTITIRTYSPFFGFSSDTEHLAWRKEPWDEFQMIIEK